MENCKVIKDESYNRDELMDLICKLRVVNNVSNSLDVEAILRSLSSREVLSTNDVSKKKDLEFLYFCFETLRIAISRFDETCLV